LVDINMPVMDGWQFLQNFRTDINEEEQLVFMVSSSIDQADIDRAKGFPFIREFISKPITADKLKELVARYSDPVI
jgi:CheY-like chemotaxis protein